MSVFQSVAASAVASRSVSTAIGNSGSVVLTTIVFPPPPVPYGYSIVATDAVKAEGNSGTTPFTFTVTRYGDTSGASSLEWWSAGGLPIGSTNPGATPSDFVGGGHPTGTLEFAAGETEKILVIDVAGDTSGEFNEGFSITLRTPQSTVAPPAGASTVAFGTILTDDATVTATWRIDAAGQIGTIAGLNAPYIYEPSSGAASTSINYWVSRTGDTSSSASIDWAVQGSGANPASAADFAGGILPSGTIQLAANQTGAWVTINVAADYLQEDFERFTVQLSNQPAGQGLDEPSADGVIFNTDNTQYFLGTGGNNTFNTSGSPAPAYMDLSQGGNDTAIGTVNDDFFYLGAALNNADKINGAAGFDTLWLDGNYAAGITLGTTTVTNIEKITLAAGNSYKLTTNDATVAAGASLIVDASSLAAINTATVNGAAEKNGAFTFLGGAGNDAFTGGTGADIFAGGLGADQQTGGSGADVFRYQTADDSALQTNGGTIITSGDDKITGFQASTDKIDLSEFGFAGTQATVLTKSTTGFSTNLNNATGFFGNAGVAVEYAGTKKAPIARVYVDTNKDGNLGTGDMLIQLTGAAKGSIIGSSFTF